MNTMLERMKERAPFIRPLLVPAILYLGLTTAVPFIHLASPWNWLVYISPMIPGLFLALGVIKVINKLDEFSRKVIIESAAVTFAISLFLILTLGFLEAGGLLHIESIYIAMFMAVTWLVIKLLIHRRYE
jgi:hypothetical protein